MCDLSYAARSCSLAGVQALLPLPLGEGCGESLSQDELSCESLRVLAPETPRRQRRALRERPDLRPGPIRADQPAQNLEPSAYADGSSRVSPVFAAPTAPALKGSGRYAHCTHGSTMS